MDKAGFFSRFFALVLDSFAIAFVSGFFFSLGFIWAAFDANGEAWHDKLFDTHVVRA